MNFLKLKLNSTSILGCFVAFISLSIFLTSCEKDTVETTKTEIEEGYKSTTNNTEVIIDDQPEIVEPVLHMRFDGNLTRDEVKTKWETQVKGYMDKYKLENPQLSERGVSTELFFSVYTKTGCQSYNDTDGSVYARINFRSNNGTRTTSWYNLNNAGDDREKCNWDLYLNKRDGLNGQVISWAQARWAQLALKGTDGWFPTDFDIHIHASSQTIPATGSSHIYSAPNVWLDNSSSNSWDYYNTGNVGFGTLNF